MDEHEAKEIFINLVTDLVYETTKEGVHERLSPDSDDETSAALRSFLSGLDQAKKELILKAIDEAISLTVFNFLVLLDNKTAGSPLEDTPSDFGLYLQSAEDEDVLYHDQPANRVRINQSYSSGRDLHDAFMERIEGP